MSPAAPRARAPFPPTRQSMVEGARSEDAGERRAAFERVVQAYWQPVYAYLRIRGAAPEDAEDLTQGFFARAFEKRFFDAYDPARARFRTFVRTCLDGYAANERVAERRLKRGGGAPLLSLDFADAERALPLRAAPADDPEGVFHREWVRALCAEAVEEVRRRCRASGREVALQLFERCDLSDLADADRPSYAALAAELGLPLTQVTNLLASARREFRAALRDTLRARTASDAEFEDEVLWLLGGERAVSLRDPTVDHLLRIAGEAGGGSGRYEMREEIGRGGMGVVHRARDGELGRDVALKVLRAGGEDLARRLHREARVLASLEHPGMIPVHDVGVLDDGRAFYVMKLVRGRRLDEWTAEGPSLAARLRAFERICETVAFAHAHGVIHRDLKPGNVMLGEFGEVLVMDWGVAKVLAEASLDTPVTDLPGVETAAGTVLGTPGYMAPEQAAGDARAVDARTDVYALGGVLHYLVAGWPPTSGALPAGTPRPLAAIIHRCLAAARTERYASVMEVAADVRAFQAQDPVSAYPEGPLRRAGRIASRYRVPIALVLAYMLMRVALILAK